MVIIDFLSGFFILFLLTAAFPCYIAVCKERRPEPMFLISLLTNGLLFYAFSIFRLVNTGFYILLVLNLLWYIPAAVRLCKQPDLLKRLFTANVVIAWSIFAVLLIFSWSRCFLQWDEYSHWGFAARILFEREGLSCLFGNFMSHASYPPGMALLQVFVHKCFVFSPFREGLIIAGNLFFIIMCVLSVMGDCRLKEKYSRGLTHALTLCSLMLIMLFSIFSRNLFCVYSDLGLALLSAFAIFRLFRAKQTWQDDLELMLLLTWILLIKKSGIPTVILILIFYAIRLWIFRKERHSIFEKLSPAAVFLVPFAILYSWSLLLKHCNTPIQFSAKGITMEKIIDLVQYGKPEYSKEVLANMFYEFFVADPMLLTCFIIFVALYVLYIFFGKNKPAAPLGLYIFAPLYFVLMMFFLFLTYIFIFSDYQALKLVSYQRYSLAFLATGIMLYLFFFLTDGIPVKRQLSEKHSAILAGVMVLLFGIFIERYYNFLRHTVDSARRREMNNAVRKYDHILRKNDVKFMVLTAKDFGQKNFMFQYEYPDQFVRDKHYNPQIKEENVTKKRDGIVISVEDLKEVIRNYTHILIDMEDEDFFRDYADIFEDKPITNKFQVLYLVTPEGKLRYLPPARLNPRSAACGDRF